MQRGVAIYELGAKLWPDEVRLREPDFKKCYFVFDVVGLRLFVLHAPEP